MGGGQAASVLGTIKKDQLDADGISMTEDEINELKEPILEKYEKEGHPYYSSARLWDDGIITPIETRTILINAFKVVSDISPPDPSFPVFRM